MRLSPEMIGKKIRRGIAAAVLIIFALMLFGCGAKDSAEEDPGQSTEQNPDQRKEQSPNEPGPARITTAEMLRGMRMFSKWDVKDTVDREFCTEILFSGSQARVTGKGASAEGAAVTIHTAGSYYISGKTEDGRIIINADPLDKIRLIFGGVDMTSKESACLLVRMADKVLVTLEDGTVNRFADGGVPYKAVDGIYGVDAVLFAKEDLTINGSGEMIVEAGYAHGICTKDDLVIYGGKITVSAPDKGLIGEDSVRIRNCALNVTAGDDAIHTKTDYKEGKGFVYLESGDVTLAGGDDAIHAATAVLIEGGALTVTECKEGIEGATVVIGGGTVNITSNDDGINACYREDDEEPFDADGENDPHVQEDTFIRIEGGEITIDAAGDGLDSNGKLYLNGGTVTISGQTREGSLALDSGCGIEENGTQVNT